MATQQLNEKIKEIISKIDNNSATQLERPQVEALLASIKNDFEILWQSADNNYKPVIQGQAQRLLTIIESNLREAPRWIGTQNNLNQIKDILIGLGNEIALLEQKLTQPITTTVQQTTTIQTPTERKSFTDTVVAHEKSALELAKVGAEKEGILGGMIGAAAGTASVFTTGVAQLADNVQLDVKEAYENTRAGAERSWKEGLKTFGSAFKEGADVWREGLKGGVKAKGLWGTELQIGGSSTAEAQIEALKKQLAEKDKLIAEKDKQIALYERLISK